LKRQIPNKQFFSHFIYLICKETSGLCGRDKKTDRVRAGNFRTFFIRNLIVAPLKILNLSGMSIYLLKTKSRKTARRMNSNAMEAWAQIRIARFFITHLPSSFR
jgi:hypothetical protein